MDWFVARNIRDDSFLIIPAKISRSREKSWFTVAFDSATEIYHMLRIFLLNVDMFTMVLTTLLNTKG